MNELIRLSSFLDIDDPNAEAMEAPGRTLLLSPRSDRPNAGRSIQAYLFAFNQISFRVDQSQKRSALVVVSRHQSRELAVGDLQLRSRLLRLEKHQPLAS